MRYHTGAKKAYVLDDGGTRCPSWLGAVAPEAQVNERVLEIFESFKDKDQCLAQVMQSVTGMANQVYAVNLWLMFPLNKLQFWMFVVSSFQLLSTRTCSVK